MENTAFWCGIGAGMVLGAAVGMAVSPRQRSMKTCVGRTMQHMGNAPWTTPGRTSCTPSSKFVPARRASEAQK